MLELPFKVYFEKNMKILLKIFLKLFWEYISFGWEKQWRDNVKEKIGWKSVFSEQCCQISELHSMSIE